MKKLDILIIRSFIGPFFATFLISLFVLVIQFFWLYLDDLVGKGLDGITILRLIGYLSATLVPMALPLALLLSSIMTFGNLGESFELVAIKSAGIPLLRFMQPLFIIAVLISGVAFLFSNNIIPVANLKLNALKYDVIVKKPAFDIKEGVFYDKLEGYVIKIGKKEKDDSTISNIIIYEKNYDLQDNILTAQSGVMRISADKHFMEFELYNGWRYEEKGNNFSINTQFTRMGFKEYTKVFDLSSFKMNNTQDSLFKYDPKMLSLRQLNTAIDSLSDPEKKFSNTSQKILSPYLSFLQYHNNIAFKSNDSNRSHNLKKFNNLIPDSIKGMIYDRALAKINNIKTELTLAASDYEAQKDSLLKHQIEWNRKFTLSAACIVFFMIGAPLGSIIRKGGLGAPLVFAIIFFVIFYLFNNIGEKFAKQGVLSPFAGMWLSTGILIPIGIFLTVKAMRDSQLFSKEFYYRSFKIIKSFISK